MKISIIDDNIALSKSIEKFFIGQKHSVKLYHSKQDFMSAKYIPADVYIIDVDLKDGSGLEIARHLRVEKHNDSPVLMISWDEWLNTKLEGFEVGADDYIVKPFSPLELDARVKTIMQRSQWEQPGSQLVYNNITFNTKTRRLSVDEVDVDISKKEKEILEILMESKWKLVTKEKLAKWVWNKNFDDIQNTMNVSLCKLRKKLGNWFKLETINSEWYILEK